MCYDRILHVIIVMILSSSCDMQLPIVNFEALILLALGQSVEDCLEGVGVCSRNSSGLSASRRLCGSCLGFASPRRAVSRFYLFV
jgi:hypothetical protein